MTRRSSESLEGKRVSGYIVTQAVSPDVTTHTHTHTNTHNLSMSTLSTKLITINTSTKLKY